MKTITTTSQSNRRIAMKSLAGMTALTEACLVALAGCALVSGHAQVYVNRPPVSVVWELPSSLQPPAAISAIPLWTGAEAPLDWNSLVKKASPGSGAPVLRAASRDTQPADFPGEDSVDHRRTDVALHDWSVNVQRCERVQRRAAPRRPAGRLDLARFNHNRNRTS